MDRDELTHRPEKPEEQVPTSPCAIYEKPRVPLNNLKMRFERGEEAMGKVVTDRSTGEEHVHNTFETHCDEHLFKHWHPLDLLIIQFNYLQKLERTSQFLTCSEIIIVPTNEALSLFFIDSCDSCASIGRVSQALTVTTMLMFRIYCTDGG